MLRALLLLTVVLLTAAGCAGSPGEGTDVAEGSDDGRFEQVALADVRVWRSVEATGDFLEAEVVGTLGYDVECGAYLSRGDGDLRYPVVWPEGTQVANTDPVTLELPDGTTLTVGDVVAGGGGFQSDLALFPEGCADSGEIAIFNASGDITVTAAHTGSGPATPSPTQSPAVPAADASHTPIPVPTMTAPPEGACGPQSTGTIEFADVLTLDGRTYHAVAPDRGPTAVTVGALHAMTSCRLADGAPLDGDPTPDGAAAYLAVGTPIHEVNDHDPAFRVIALTGQNTVIYQSLDATPAGHPLAALDAVGVDFVAQGTTQSVGSPRVPADELITALQDGDPVSPAQDELLCSDRVNLSVTLSDGSIIGAIVYPSADAAALHTAPGYLSLAPATIETLVAEAPAEAISQGSFACD